MRPGMCTSCKTRPYAVGMKTCQRCLDKFRVARADSHRRRKYQIEPEDMRSLRDAQDNRCAICKEVLVRACVDHEHVSSENKKSTVRGLLCGPCNTGLGGFKDSILVLQSACEYLQNPPARSVFGRNNV